MNWAITHNFKKIQNALSMVEPRLGDAFKKAVQDGDERGVNRLLARIPQDERLLISLELSNDAIGLDEEESKIEFFLR